MNELDTDELVPASNWFPVDEFRARLESLRGDLSVHAFAQKCRVADSGMRKYLKGERLPVVDTLAQIARVNGASVSWLALGEGPRDAAALTKVGLPALDVDLLKNVLIAVDGHLRDHNLVMKTDKKAALVALLYDHFAEKDGRVEADAFRRFMDALS
jgi:transcriptional regulator with XRE-family HTH domain